MAAEEHVRAQEKLEREATAIICARDRTLQLRVRVLAAALRDLDPGVLTMTDTGA